MEKGMKITSAMLRHKSFKYIIIPLILLFFWILASVFFNSGVSLSVITQNLSISQKNSTKLLKNQSVKGIFTADENNLGIISVRFEPHQAIAYENEDRLLFQIKEKGTNTWYYQNTYRSGLIYGSSLFPFGFPPILNSKSKTYEFRIISMAGTSENAVTLSSSQPNVVLSYQVDKKDIIKSPKALLNFIYKKLLTTFDTVNLFFSSTVYLIPLLLYILYLILEIFNIPTIFYKIGTVFLILLQIVLIPKIYFGLSLAILLIWFILVYRNKEKNTHTFIVAFLLLVITVPLTINGSENWAEKTAWWGYLFFIFGIIQSVMEMRRFK